MYVAELVAAPPICGSGQIQSLGAVAAVGSEGFEARVYGGGKRSQADALKLAIARALLEDNEARRRQLKDIGLLTRDPRMKERKKPGLKRARGAPQFSKR